MNMYILEYTNCNLPDVKFKSKGKYYELHEFIISEKPISHARDKEKISYDTLHACRFVVHKTVSEFGK